MNHALHDSYATRFRAMLGPSCSPSIYSQESFRAAAGGAACACRRTLGRVHGRVGVPVGVVTEGDRRIRQSSSSLVGENSKEIKE